MNSPQGKRSCFRKIIQLYGEGYKINTNNTSVRNTMSYLIPNEIR